MRLRTLHEWKVSTQEAIAIQKRLCKEIIQTDAFRYIKKIAGIDVGFEANGRIVRAAICIFNYPQLALIEQVLHKQPCTFPYVPGLLSFREAPAILSGLAQIEHQPDLLLCDGQGIAHPRRFGIACHLGLLTDLPSIGVGKSRLIRKPRRTSRQPRCLATPTASARDHRCSIKNASARQTALYLQRP